MYRWNINAKKRLGRARQYFTGVKESVKKYTCLLTAFTFSDGWL